MSLSDTAVGMVSWTNSSTDPPEHGSFLVLPNKTVQVGRDVQRNDVAFTIPVVSRCQLEIFSLVVDEEYSHPPLVFVRDRGSANGTAVNGKVIGKGVKLSPSRLLMDGDVITIGDYVHLKLTYIQLLSASPRYALTPLQRQEVELFQDRYVVTDLTIGDGGNAVVYLAIEVSTGQHAVCKVHDIRRFPSRSRKVERIRQEAILLSTLDHPNILPVKAAFETSDTIYVIAELATGGDLFALMMRYNQLDEMKIRAVLRQVLRAVAYIHQKGVAHRDIKPENVLCGITPSAPYRIMLSDFGDSGIPFRHGTSPNRLKSSVGTKFYRPPECEAPGSSHDFSVDIWAIGMMTVQLLLGYQELPGLDTVMFHNQTEIDAYLDEVFEQIEELRQSSISGMARDFVRKCLVFDSAQRPTARDLFYHGWLQHPKSDRNIFERLEADTNATWRPQRIKYPLIEEIVTSDGGLASPKGWGDGPQREGQAAMNGTISTYFAAQNRNDALALRPKVYPGPAADIVGA